MDLLNKKLTELDKEIRQIISAKLKNKMELYILGTKINKGQMIENKIKKLNENITITTTLTTGITSIATTTTGEKNNYLTTSNNGDEFTLAKTKLKIKSQEDNSTKISPTPKQLRSEVVTQNRFSVLDEVGEIENHKTNYISKRTKYNI